MLIFGKWQLINKKSSECQSWRLTNWLPIIGPLTAWKPIERLFYRWLCAAKRKLSSSIRGSHIHKWKKNGWWVLAVLLPTFPWWWKVRGSKRRYRKGRKFDGYKCTDVMNSKIQRPVMRKGRRLFTTNRVDWKRVVVGSLLTMLDVFKVMSQR